MTHLRNRGWVALGPWSRLPEHSVGGPTSRRPIAIDRARRASSRDGASIPARSDEGRNVPGEAASVMTTRRSSIARRGRAGAALSIVAIGSFAAGMAAVAALALLTPLLSEFALRFNAPEYFLLASLGITASISRSAVR